MNDSAAVKLTRDLLSFVTFDDQNFYEVERSGIVKHTKTIPHDDIVYDYTCKQRENQTWDCFNRPSLQSFLRRKLRSTNYMTTCYLNSCLIALLAFKNTRFHALLTLQDACKHFLFGLAGCPHFDNTPQGEQRAARCLVHASIRASIRRRNLPASSARRLTMRLSMRGLRRTQARPSVPRWSCRRVAPSSRLTHYVGGCLVMSRRIPGNSTSAGAA